MVASNSRLSFVVRWLRFGAAVAIGVAVMACGSWISVNVSVKARVRTLRSHGQPTTLRELEEYYSLPADTKDTTDAWVAATDAIDEEKIWQLGMELPFVGIGPDPPAADEPWEQLNDAEAFLHECSTEMMAVRNAVNAGGVARYPVDLSRGIDIDFSSVFACRPLARLLLLEAYVHVNHGRESRVLENLLGLCAVARSLDFMPVGEGFIVQNSIFGFVAVHVPRLLPRCEWNDAELAQLQVAIAQGNSRAYLDRVLRGQRANCFEFLSHVQLGPFRITNFSAALRYYDRVIHALDHSWPDAMVAGNMIFKGALETDAPIEYRIRDQVLCGLSSLAAMGSPHLTYAGARTEARRRCLVTVIAARRAQLRLGWIPDAPPSSMPEVWPPGAEISVLHTDPYGGEGLIYSVSGNQISVYSVGYNGVDDGGRVTEYDGNDLVDVGLSTHFQPR